MHVRPLLERLEREAGDVAAPLAFLAAQGVPLDEDELRAARRRGVLLLATGGDPRRELEPDGRAVASLAADLEAPERRRRLAEELGALRAASRGLPRVSAALDGLLADGEAAWRWFACALLADELAADGDE